MKKSILILVLLTSLVLIGSSCTLIKGFWSGLTGQETPSTQSAQKIDQDTIAIAQSISATLSSGKLDLTQLAALITNLQTLSGDVKDYTNKSESEKPNFLEWLGAMVGIAAGTYLGTRRIRQSPVGTAINSVLAIFKKTTPNPPAAAG